MATTIVLIDVDQIKKFIYTFPILPAIHGSRCTLAEFNNPVPFEYLIDRRILCGYFCYYHSCSNHLSLDNNSPDTRAVELPESGKVVAYPCVVDGLHHCYARVAA